jgi:aryl-alcohol dehydrogenase
MKITAAIVPVRSAPFEIETLDLAAPLADEVLVRIVASGMCHTDATSPLSRKLPECRCRKP